MSSWCSRGSLARPERSGRPSAKHAAQRPLEERRVSERGQAHGGAGAGQRRLTVGAPGVEHSSAKRFRRRAVRYVLQRTTDPGGLDSDPAGRNGGGPLEPTDPRTQGALFRYSVQTGARAGPFVTGVRAGWPAQSGTSPGTNPGPTAVNVYERTVWVANRGQLATSAGAGVAQLDFDGAMRCFANVAGPGTACAPLARSGHLFHPRRRGERHRGQFHPHGPAHGAVTGGR